MSPSTQREWLGSPDATLLNAYTDALAPIAQPEVPACRPMHDGHGKQRGLPHRPLLAREFEREPREFMRFVGSELAKCSVPFGVRHSGEGSSTIGKARDDDGDGTGMA